MNTNKTIYTQSSRKTAPQYRGNPSNSSYSYSHQSGKFSGSKYSGSQAPRRGAGNDSQTPYQGGGYQNHYDESYDHQGALDYGEPSYTVGSSSYNRGGHGKSSYNQSKRPQQYYESTNASAYPKSYKQNEYYNETAEYAYEEEEIETYYDESYYNKGAAYNKHKNSSRDGNEHAQERYDQDYSRSAGAGNNLQYSDSYGNQQQRQQPNRGAQISRIQQSDQRQNQRRSNQSFGRGAPLDAKKRSEGYQESETNIGYGRPASRRQNTAYNNEGYGDAQYLEKDQYYEQYYNENYYSQEVSNNYDTNYNGQDHDASHEDEATKKSHDDQIYRYRRKKGSTEPYSDHYHKENSQEILPSQMVIVVKDKDGGNHDQYNETEMPAQPHRKVIIKSQENQSEPDEQRRDSSSSWASCDETPADSQVSLESSQIIENTTPLKQGSKIQYQVKKQQQAPTAAAQLLGGQPPQKMSYQKDPQIKQIASRQNSESTNSPLLRHQNSKNYYPDGEDPLEKDALIYQLPEVEFKLLEPHMNSSQTTPAVPELTNQNSNQPMFVRQYKNQMTLEGGQIGNGGAPINSNMTTLQIRSVQNLNVVAASPLGDQAALLAHSQWLSQNQQANTGYLRQVQLVKSVSQDTPQRTVHYNHDYAQQHVPLNQQAISPYTSGPVDDQLYGLYYQNQQSPQQILQQQQPEYPSQSRGFTVTQGGGRGGHSQVIQSNRQIQPIPQQQIQNQQPTSQMYYMQQQMPYDAGYAQEEALQDEYYGEAQEVNDNGSTQLNLDARQFYPSSRQPNQPHLTHSLSVGAELLPKQEGAYQIHPHQQFSHQPSYGEGVGNSISNQLTFNMQAKEFVPSYKKKQAFLQDPYLEINQVNSTGGGIPVMMSEHYLQNYQAQQLSPEEIKYMQLLQSQQQQQHYLIQQQQQQHQQQHLQYQQQLNQQNPALRPQPQYVGGVDDAGLYPPQNQQQYLGSRSQQMLYDQQHQFYLQQQQNEFYQQQFYQNDPRLAPNESPGLKENELTEFQKSPENKFNEDGGSDQQQQVPYLKM